MLLLCNPVVSTVLVYIAGLIVCVVEDASLLRGDLSAVEQNMSFLEHLAHTKMLVPTYVVETWKKPDIGFQWSKKHSLYVMQELLSSIKYVQTVCTIRVRTFEFSLVLH